MKRKFFFMIENPLSPAAKGNCQEHLDRKKVQKERNTMNAERGECVGEKSGRRGLGKENFSDLAGKENTWQG